MLPVIGEVQESVLLVYVNQDLDFDIIWTHQDGTPINFAAVESVVFDPDTDATLLDLAAFTTMTGNMASVRVPQATLSAALEVGRVARWHFTATSDTGSTKMLTHGYARIRNA